MNQEDYEAFTATLLKNLQEDKRVLGLVALGSMAQQDYRPDRWSDHDFFVIVEPGEQEFFRANLDWLPHPAGIVFSFRETAHGLKVLYQDGHLLEFAVFDPEELGLAKVNRYRVLWDRARLETRLENMKRESEQSLPEDKSAEEDFQNFGQFITNLLVGVGRYRRGEKLSGHEFVKMHALRQLLGLLEKHLPSPRKPILDNLNPFRRFEIAYPELGETIYGLLSRDCPAAALGMLNLADQELSARLTGYPTEGVRVVREYISAL